MLEIGSEFWKTDCSEKKNTLFPAKVKWFLSGQNALNYIIADIKSKYNVKSIALPSWCCDSIIIPFIINKFAIQFYDVRIENGKLKQEANLQCDVILVMDYFGYETKYDFSSYKGIVIRDMTHSLLIKKYVDADYYFGSLRKWSGIYTGGYAWCNEEWKTSIEILDDNKKYVDLRKKAMEQKEKYIQGETKSKVYLSLFADAEEILDEFNLKGVYSAEKTDVLSAQFLDADKIKEKRRKNVERLLKDISVFALFPVLGEKDCPLFVPIIVEKRDELKHFLIENSVYCPSHWPISKYHVLNKKTRVLYDKELSIVCDQRYSEEDMKKIIYLIKKFNNC